VRFVNVEDQVNLWQNKEKISLNVDFEFCEVFVHFFGFVKCLFCDAKLVKNDLFSFFFLDVFRERNKPNKTKKRRESDDVENRLLVVGSKALEELLLVWIHFHSLVHILSFLLLCRQVETLDFGLLLSDSLLEGSFLVSGSFRSEQFSSSQSFGIWIQFQQSSQISKRIFLVDNILLHLDLVSQLRLNLL